MIKETTAYVCSDGTVFSTRTEAEAYEAHVRAVNEVTSYRNALFEAGASVRVASQRSNAVIEYLEWRDNGKTPSVDAKKIDEDTGV